MAGERQLLVKIVGDDKSLQAAFARSSASTKAFSANVSKSLSGGVSVGKSFDPLLARVKESQAKAEALSKQLAAMDTAAAGAGSGTAGLTGGLGALALRAGLASIAINATYQGVRHLQDALEATGTEAFTTSGKLKNFGASLLTGDVVGAVQALSAQPKTLEDLGISATEAANRLGALQIVADGAGQKFLEQSTASDKAGKSADRYKQAIDEAGTGNAKLAQELINQVAALQAADNATNALADSTARLGTVFVTSTGDAVAFKGAVDDLAGPRGPGAVDAINAALEQAQGGFGKQISPGAARTAKETIARASGDLQALLKLQQKDQAAAKQALNTSNAVGKDREALNQSLAEATAAVITTGKQIKAQNDATKGTVAEVRKADPAAQWAKIIAGLQLGVDRAGLDKQLGNDLTALQHLKAGLEKQVKSGVDVASAQSNLVTVTGQIAAKQTEIREKLADALQSKQFRELGLSGTGEEIVPGPGNLAKRLKEALSQVDSGDLDISSKLVAHLREAQKTVAKEGDNLTKVTREKVNDFIKAANGQGADEITGPLTQRKSVELSNNILKALGFLKNTDVTRLSNIQPSSFKAAAFVGPRTDATAGVTINGPITIVSDDPVASLRGLQKAAGRTSATSRGRFPGRNLGLG